MLVEQSIVAPDVVEQRLAQAESSGIHVGRVLVDTGTLSPDQLLRVIAQRLDIAFHGDPDLQLDPGAAAYLDRAVASHYKVVPLRLEGDAIVVGMANPLDAETLTKVSKKTGRTVTGEMIPQWNIKGLLERAYPADASPAQAATPDEPLSGSALAPGAAPAPIEIISDDSESVHINTFLNYLMDVGGSDLHLTVGIPPQVRRNGKLEPIPGFDKLLPNAIREMIYTILSSRHREELEETLELDCSHPLPGRGRFRVNVFFQRGSLGAVLRAIPNEIMTLQELGMPDVVATFGDMKRGIVLVTGATGSGKSTTLASLIDKINRERAVHIMTVEDPIEFIHNHKKGVVNQREVGADTGGFSNALRAALRQDPDVILVGELRDLETMSTALTAAETGHLVFATLHTQSAPQSVDRIIDVFPSHQQQQVRVQLAGALQGVVTQQLIPTADGKGRVAAVEVMVAIPAIRNLIREGKVHQMGSIIQSGGKYGMQTMDQALVELVRKGKVSMADATERSVDPEEFATMVGGA